MLYKLNEGVLFECPETIRVITNDEEIKKKFGWKPYLHTEPPEYDSSVFLLKHGYTETETDITDVYELVPMPVPDESEV